MVGVHSSRVGALREKLSEMIPGESEQSWVGGGSGARDPCQPLIHR